MRTHLARAQRGAPLPQIHEYAAMPRPKLCDCAPDADWHEYEPGCADDEDSREGSGDGDDY